MAKAAPRTYRRLPNPRRVKIHRNYSVEEVARLLGVHKNTVREWVRAGLPAMTDQRPLLILGSELATFLTRRRHSAKRPCLPGEIYCVRCRIPQKPAGGMADYRPQTPTGGSLVGICPRCDSVIYRRVSLAGLHLDRGQLDIVLPKAREHINETDQPFVNCDLKQE